MMITMMIMMTIIMIMMMTMIIVLVNTYFCLRLEEDEKLKRINKMIETLRRKMCYTLYSKAKYTIIIKRQETLQNWFILKNRWLVFLVKGFFKEGYKSHSPAQMLSKSQFHSTLATTESF